jgi:hypothetical protein
MDDTYEAPAIATRAEIRPTLIGIASGNVDTQI